MNKNVYRIVFNKARRMYMVASENTHAKAKATLLQPTILLNSS